MRKIIFTSLFLVGIIFSPTFSLAQEIQDCASLEYDTEFIFHTSYGQLRYDFSKSKQELTSIGQKYGNLEQGLFASGLSTIDINWELAVDTISTIAGSDDTICVVPSKVDLYIGYEDPVIYISKDLEIDSCQYNMVLRHEQTHQQINKTALEYFIPHIKTLVEQIIKDIKPVEVDSIRRIAPMNEQITSDYINKIQPLVEYFKQEVKSEQLKLDNLDNYAFEGRLCQD